MAKDIDIPQVTAQVEKQKPVGLKRRPWINNDEDNAEPNRVYKPDLSIGFIDPVDRPIKTVEESNRNYNPYLSIGSPIDRPIKITLENLRSNPLDIVRYIYDLSKEEECRVTPRVTRSEIARDLEMSMDSLKTALTFLTKHCFIEVVHSVVGKLGWTKYKLNDDLFNEIAKSCKE